MVLCYNKLYYTLFINIAGFYYFIVTSKMQDQTGNSLTLVLILFFVWQVKSISSLSGNTGIQFIDQSDNPINIAIPQNDQTQWQDFKNSQNKRYSTPEQQTYRMLVYNYNLNQINSYNNAQKETLSNSFSIRSTGYFTKKINQFGDLSQRQFRQIYCSTYPSDSSVIEKANLEIQKQKNKSCSCNSNQGFIGNIDQIKYETQLTTNIQELIRRYDNIKLESPDLRTIFSQNLSVTSSQNFTITNKSSSINFTSSVAIKDNISRTLQQVSNPTTNQLVQIDWTSHAGSIKFQGLCGCCYTFATTDTLSAINSIYKYGFFVSLSKQQLIDCPNNGLTFGCNGGFLQGAYAYIQSNGITTQFAYPYIKKQQNCTLNKGSFKIANFKNLNPTCNDLITQLKKKPVSIGIAGFRLQFYSSGVFDDCNTFIDHAVVLIGYKSGVGWKIKNSWGPDWGMKGYAWIKDGNNCGICQNAVSATIEEQKTK